MALWGTGKQFGIPRLAPNGFRWIQGRSVALAERLQALFRILAHCPAEVLVTMGLSWIRSLRRVSGRVLVLYTLGGLDCAEVAGFVRRSLPTVLGQAR